MKQLLVSYRPEGFTGPIKQEEITVPESTTAKEAKRQFELKYGNVVAFHVQLVEAEKPSADFSQNFPPITRKRQYDEDLFGGENFER